MYLNVRGGHHRGWEQWLFPAIWKGIYFVMAGKLTARTVDSRAKRKGRYSDGDGLFLRVLDPGKRVYWTYRFTLGKEREMSIGPYPELSLADARQKHAELRGRS